MIVNSFIIIAKLYFLPMNLSNLHNKQVFIHYKNNCEQKWIFFSKNTNRVFILF